MTTRQLSWENVLAAALVAAIAVALWQTRILAPIALPQAVGRPNGDLYTIYYPLYSFAYRGAEWLPAWNPYQLAGTPTVGYLAGGLYYPPNWLSAIVPVHRALGHLVAFHLALAGVGTWLVARAAGVSRAAALLAAVAFLANPYLVGEHLRPMYLFGLAWIPLVALRIGRMVDAPTVRNAILLAFATALQFLTGHVQIVCYEVWVGIAVGGPAILVLGRARGVAYVGRCIGAAAIAAVATTLLVTAQLWPTLEVVSQAVRGFGGLTVEQTLPARPSWALLRNVAAAHGLALLVVPAALLAAGRKGLVVGICIAVAAIAGAIGMGTAAFDEVFFRLPGVALFRLPQQMLAVGGLAIAILAAIGLDELATRRFGGGSIVALAALGAVGWGLRSELGPLAVVAFGVAMLGVLLAARLPGVGALALAAIVAIGAGERFAHTRNTVMIPAANPDAFFAEPPVMGFLKARVGFDRVVVIKDWKRRFPLMEKVGSLYGVSVVQDYEPLTPNVYHEFLRGLDLFNADQPLFWGRFLPPPTGLAWRPLDLLSARYVVVARTTAWRSVVDRFRWLYEDDDAIVYENTQALPRALVIARHRVLDREQTLRAVTMPRFDPRAEILLDRDPGGGPDVESGSGPAGDATIVAQTVTTLTVRANATMPAFLLVNDLYWPGWHATVDAEPAEIVRANLLFRAVRLPAGEHVISFAYDGRTLRYAAATSIVTIVVLLALLAHGIVSRRRRASDEHASRRSESDEAARLPGE